MNIDDIKKGMEVSTDILENNKQVKIQLEDDPLYIRRITKKFKTADGKECICAVFVGVFEDAGFVRLLRRGVYNWGKFRHIPTDITEECIKG